MSRGHLTSSDLSDHRAEVVITRRDPNLAKPEIRYTLGPNPDSAPVPTSVGSSKVLGTPNPGSATLNTPATSPLPDSPLNWPIRESPLCFLRPTEKLRYCTNRIGGGTRFGGDCH